MEFNYDIEPILPSGRKVYFTTLMRPVKNGNGKIINLFGTIQDITERKQAEKTLTREQYLMNALMNNLPDHIYFKDKESRFIRINDSQAQSFGLSVPGEEIGKTDFDFFY